MKVKIFSGKASDIEDEINEFINGKEVIDIKQSESMGDEVSTWAITITVLYED